MVFVKRRNQHSPNTIIPFIEAFVITMYNTKSLFLVFDGTSMATLIDAGSCSQA